MDKEAGLFDKLKNPAMLGLMGLGLMGSPDDAEAKGKIQRKTPAVQVQRTPAKVQPPKTKVQPSKPKVPVKPKQEIPPKAPEIPTSQPAETEQTQAEAVNIEEWVDRVIHQESRGNPKAKSPVGARGLMQLMPQTWAEVTKKIYGKPLPFDKAEDPEINRKAGTYYLKWLQSNLRRMMNKEPTIEQILAAYNGGIGRLKQKGWDVSKMPPESRDYAAKITKMDAKPNG